MKGEALEIVLRYAYAHNYTCQQWAAPTKECFQKSDVDLSSELCDLLLTRFFSQTRVTEPLLERYIAFATTGTDHPTSLTITNQAVRLPPCLIPSKTFLLSLIKFVELTATMNPFQWSHILKILPTILSSIDADRILSDMLNNDKQGDWPTILSNVFIMLSKLVAVGLYRDHYMSIRNNQTEEQPSMLPPTMSSQPGGISTQPFDSSSQWNIFPASQLSTFDPDGTIDLDSFAQESESQQEPASHEPEPSSQVSTKDGEHVETSNAILAAQIMISLIENKNAKRIFEVMNNDKHSGGSTTAHEAEEPWSTCQSILAAPTNRLKTVVPDTETLQNSNVQKLMLLISRLTDRELDRRMAVHLKYKELEDEGTARALPSAGLMGLLYHVVQVRPTLDNDFVVDYLAKLQTIKGSFDESFYLELWFAGLTGLREASVANHPKSLEKQVKDGSAQQPDDLIISIDCLLWRALVLVKIPYYIQKLEERKQASSNGLSKMTSEFMAGQSKTETNSIKASLMELKIFTGLLNGCNHALGSGDGSFPFASSKTNEFGGNEDDEDDIMKMINDMGPSVDLSSPEVTKAVRAIANEDIMTSIVRVCEHLGFLSKKAAESLISPSPSKDAPANNPPKKEDNDDFSSLLDIDMLGIDENESKEWDMPMEGVEQKTSDYDIISQNIEQRIDAIKNSPSKSAIVELLHIASVSMLHLQQVTHFVTELIHEKAALRDMVALAKICDALNTFPQAIDIIFLLHHPKVILRPVEEICNTWKTDDSELDMDNRSGSESQGDEDFDGVSLLYRQFGKVWAFLVSVIEKFKLSCNANDLFENRQGFCWQFFSSGPLMDDLDAVDPTLEEFIQKWQEALLENQGVSDDLLRLSSPQLLVQIAPTLFGRAILACHNGHLETGTLLGIVSYFQERFLNFVLVPAIIRLLCEALFSGDPSLAVLCLHRLIIEGQPSSLLLTVSSSYVLGSLTRLLEQRRQERIVHDKNAAGDQAGWEGQAAQIQDFLRQKLGINNKDVTQHRAETVTTHVTYSNICRKARDMFYYIVKSGRSMFMRDVDADTVALWDPSKAPKQVTVHYLDMVMFQVALDTQGPHWFVSMIAEQVLEAGKSGGAVRAAELGSCLVALPLTQNQRGYTRCASLLLCLLQDVIPTTLEQGASTQASFFQGQTLGVFTSNCMVLLHSQNGSADSVFVDELCRRFFRTLVVDSENSLQIINKRVVQQDTDAMQGLFVPWSKTVTQAPIWRGFIKGLMSNPLVNETWPNTFSFV